MTPSVVRSSSSVRDALILLCLMCPLIFLVTTCGAEPVWHETFALDTICRVKFFGKTPAAFHTVVFERIAGLEEILSANRDGSDLDRVNRNAGAAPVPVHPEFIEVLTRALYFAGLSWDSETERSAFDPTIGPLVKLWGIGTVNEHIPDEHDIIEALSLIDWRAVTIDNQAGTVYLAKPDMQLDLGAIAKGYIADEVVRAAKAAGVRRMLLDLGGNIYALGGKTDTAPFSIGVQDPLKPRGAYKGILDMRNATLVTSGGYERYFEQDGVRYHHILSTTTGYPVWNELLSVTIAGTSSMDADAWSTTAFALGYEKGHTLLEAQPGIDYIFIFEDGSIKMSDSLQAHFRRK